MPLALEDGNQNLDFSLDVLNIEIPGSNEYIFKTNCHYITFDKYEGLPLNNDQK